MSNDSAQNRNSRTILIVEDEAIIALDTSEHLRKEGYKVVVASTGENAVAAISESPDIDLILMDINLGTGIDGTAAAVEILKCRDIPIVFISSHTEKELIDRTENITSYGFVFKNSGTAILTASIKMAFRLYETRRQLQISEERYHSFIRQSTEGIYCLEMDRPVDMNLPVEKQIDIIMNDAHIAECNDAFMAIYPVSSQSEIIGRQMADYYHARDDEKIRSTIRSFIEAGYRVADLQTSEAGPDGADEYFSNNAIGYVENGFLKRIWGARTDVSDRKRLEELLRQSERLYRMIFSNAPIGVLVFNTKSEIIDCNDALVQIIGSSREELLGFNLQENLKDETAQRAIEEAYTGKTVQYDGEYRSVTAGKVTYIHGWLAGVFDEDGSFINGIGMLENITEKKRIESALQESEEKYRILVENAREIIVVARDGYLLFANPRIENATGYRLDEILSRPFIEFVHPDDRNAVAANYMKRMAGEAIPDEYAFRVVHKNGEVRWVEIRVTLISWMGSPATMNIIVDITDRKHLEESLIESEAMFRTLFNGNPFIITISTVHDGRFVKVNESFERFFGYSADEAMGKTSVELNLYPDPVQRQELVTQLLEKGSLRNFEADVRKKSGEICHALFSVDTISIKDVTHIVVVLTDITELKRTQEALASSLREKDIILSELQHRVKNNLGVISSLLSLEMTNLSDDYSRTVFRDSISRIQSMSSIYEQLYQSPNLDRVDLDRYITRLSRLIFEAYTLEPGRIHLTLSVAKVSLDLKRAVPLGLILNELLTNVMKYAFPAGSGGTLGIELKNHSDHLELLVADNGKGMEHEKAGDCDDHGGMGLQIVDLLAKQIGGKFEIHGGPGTTAKVTFPFSEARA